MNDAPKRDSRGSRASKNSGRIKPLFRLGLRLSIGCCAGVLTALAIFGLVLAGLWALPTGPSAGYKLGSLIVAAVVGLTSGACLVAWVSKTYRLLSAVLFAFLLGGFSGLYIFGLDPRLWLTLPAAALCGASGGFFVERYFMEVSE